MDPVEKSAEHVAETKTEIEVDGRLVEGALGEPLLPLLRREGFSVPSLCHHSAVKPYGACRLCLVEVTDRRGRTKLTTSCNYPVMEGIKVRTQSEEICGHRKRVLELMMARAPGVRFIEKLGEEYGAEPNRLTTPPITEPCILCGLCVRVCSEVVGAGVLAMLGRGAEKHIGTPYGELPDSCIGCGACVSVCPTGAVTVALRALKRFRRAPGRERLCRYALMGLTPTAVCARSYECEGCEVEQRLAHRMKEHPIMAARRPDLEAVKDYLEERSRARQP